MTQQQDECTDRALETAHIMLDKANGNPDAAKRLLHEYAVKMEQSGQAAIGVKALAVFERAIDLLHDARDVLYE